ncbi:hypothetical protein AAU61_01675 [Desulfocarbo indianensis]|nr:hypothetical protein AAU61_01675 [Desulfocarbo indianensis]
MQVIDDHVSERIIHNLGTVVILHDLQLRAVFVNEVFESVFEIKKEEALGRSPMEFLPEFDSKHKKAIVSRLRRTSESGEESCPHEFTYVSPNGVYRYLSAKSIPIFDVNNRLTHVMSVINDLTHQKELERINVTAAKFSSFRDMAYTLAHEVSNPLTGIKLGLATLYDSLQLPENIQVLDNVMKDLERIKKTVNSILRSRRGLPNLKKENIAVLEDILKDIMANLTRQIANKSIAVNYNLALDDRYVFIDRDEIYQALLNIFLNSIDAITEEGAITVTTFIGPYDPNAPASCQSLWIRVEDTGHGLDPEMGGYVFTPYFSSKPKGTGLGLSICREILKAHNGKIEVRGEAGRGAIVEIGIPMLPPSPDR